MFVFLLPEKMRTPKVFYVCVVLCLCFYAYGVKSRIGVGNTVWTVTLIFLACIAKVNYMIK